MKKVKTGLKMIHLLLLAGMVLFGASCSKKGCTDPGAVNYDPKATKHDGSCEYDVIEDHIVVADDGNGVGTTTWHATKTYILDGLVFVNSGQTLTIEPGTVIKGRSGQGSNASALIIARGGKIIAEGTVEAPIIFTFENDPLDGSIPATTRGQWGGLIILGNATLNSDPGETAIEGVPTSETRGIYGGSEDGDNSGVLKYVSIRHGGTDIGAGNEINGLTLGGVGSGTTIEFVEIIANQDDGVEFFGGTVRTKNIVTAFCGDDSFDYDEGFRGYGQFWLTVQEPGDGDRGGEHDGGTSPEDGTLYAHPIIYNATYIGAGASAGRRILTFRDNAGGEYHNSIFYNWGKGVDIELLASGEHSYSRFESGELILKNNVFYHVAGNDETKIFTISTGSGVASADSTIAVDAFKDYFSTAGNTVNDPGISGSFSSGGINPIPSNSLISGTASSNAWFTSVTYKGAFDPSGSNWAKGWTMLDGYGYFQ